MAASFGSKENNSKTIFKSRVETSHEPKLNSPVLIHTMTVRMWRCMVSWSRLSAVYKVPVPGSSRNFRRLNGSVLLSRVKVSLFFSSLSEALICKTSVPGGLSSETFTSYHFSENWGLWLLVSMTRISTCEYKQRASVFIWLLHFACEEVQTQTEHCPQNYQSQLNANSHVC